MTSMGEPVKSALYALVDALPDGEVGAAKRYLEFLTEQAGDDDTMSGDDPYAHLDRDDAMDADDRERLHASLDRGLAQAKAEIGRPAEEVLAELRRRV